jgi:hypothetical protein
MAGALAIASVTHVLTRLLDHRLIEQGVASSLGDVVVSALPPDRIAVGGEERAQLNLFLYQLTPNTGYRARDASSQAGADPAERPLALDLHYLMTAYGERDFQAEMLIGYALQCLHDTPVMTPEVIRTLLGAGGAVGAALPPALAALSAAEVASQVEQIRISPHAMSMEDTLKLWSALQARYRLSLTYQASVVLLEGTRVAVGAGRTRELNVAAGGAP